MCGDVGLCRGCDGGCDGEVAHVSESCFFHWVWPVQGEMVPIHVFAIGEYFPVTFDQTVLYCAHVDLTCEFDV